MDPAVSMSLIAAAVAFLVSLACCLVIGTRHRLRYCVFWAMILFIGMLVLLGV